MLTAYITRAMKRAHYELLDDGDFYGAIPECPGVWASAPTLEACREELQEILEEWIVLKLQDRDPIPSIDGFELTTRVA